MQQRRDKCNLILNLGTKLELRPKMALLLNAQTAGDSQLPTVKSNPKAQKELGFVYECSASHMTRFTLEIMGHYYEVVYDVGIYALAERFARLWPS
jgi:hypothetical protein